MKMKTFYFVLRGNYNGVTSLLNSFNVINLLLQKIILKEFILS